MSRIIFILSLVFISSCITQKTISDMSGVNVKELAVIPSQTKIIYVDVLKSEKKIVFDQIITALISRDHRIQKEDKERFYISTEGKDIGQATMQRMFVSVIETDSTIRAKFTGEWMPGQNAVAMGTAIGGFAIQPNWQQIVWTDGRYGIAFAELLAIAKKVENGKIKYAFE